MFKYLIENGPHGPGFDQKLITSSLKQTSSSRIAFSSSSFRNDRDVKTNKIFIGYWDKKKLCVR